jgi:PAS domain S-box-containing protein
MPVGSHRQHLYDVFTDTDRETGTKIDAALEIGGSRLSLPIGFLTEIDGHTQKIVRATGDHGLIEPGESCPLDEAYCRRTVEIDSPMAIQNVSGSEIDQRAVDRFGLRTYIGVKVVVDGEVYGTVCFADTEERETAFSESDEVFLELLARLVGGELERRAYRQELRDRNERLEREKARFESIAETSFDIIFRVDTDGTFTYVSSAAERILGHPPERLLGEQFSGFLTDSTVDDAVAAFGELRAGRPVEHLELELPARNGEVVVLDVNATPVTEDGSVVAIQGVGRDITDRRERQRELHLKTRAMDEADIGISIADLSEPDEPLVYVNEGFERVTGYPAEEALGDNCRFLQGERTDQAAVDELRDGIEARESVTVELVNYRADGTPFWNRVALTPVEDDSGTATHYIGFQEDITGRKRIERVARLLNRVLRHNLRNDVNALLGWDEVRRQGDDPAEAAERVRDIADGLVELGERARDLDRVARRDRAPERLDPATLVGDVVAAKREAWPDATVVWRVDTDRCICAGREVVRAIGELVENALKHNPAPDRRAEVRVTDEGEWVVVTVADDGPGIDGMETDVIDVGIETELQHGSGMGLWLVNWIATRYGGGFRIDAGEDGGTTATVRLPAVEETASVAAAARRPTIFATGSEAPAPR